MQLQAQILRLFVGRECLGKNHKYAMPPPPRRRRFPQEDGLQRHREKGSQIGKHRKKPTFLPKTTLLFGNGHAFGRKYAILSIFAQPPDIQHITDFRHHSPRQISHCTLQNMPNRTAKHARPRLDALRFARRYMVFRNTNGHLSQNQRSKTRLPLCQNARFALYFTSKREPSF